MVGHLFFLASLKSQPTLRCCRLPAAAATTTVPHILVVSRLLLMFTRRMGACVAPTRNGMDCTLMQPMPHHLTGFLVPQRSGATPLAPLAPAVLPVGWPDLNGSQVENYWGKHRRTAFPRPTPSPAPPAPPAPPRPSPPPAIKCSSAAPPTGYTCFSNMCAFDGTKPAAKTGCGHDICHPGPAGAGAAGKPGNYANPASESGAALAALCSVVTGENATVCLAL